MVIVRPYKINKFTGYSGDSRITRLSLAVLLKDDYSNSDPSGHIMVNIKEEGIEAVRNLSKYHIFTDLPDLTYTVEIEPDRYFPEERIIDISEIRSLETAALDFESSGPSPGETKIKLKDISKLRKSYVVEFQNPTGNIEQKSVTNIDANNKTIYWRDGLKNSFTAQGSKISLVNYLIEIFLRPRASYPFPLHATLVRGSILYSNNLPVVNANVRVESENLATQSDENGEFVLYFDDFKNKNITLEIEKTGATQTISAILTEGMTVFLNKIIF